jgi:hypothetical protein
MKATLVFMFSIASFIQYSFCQDARSVIVSFEDLKNGIVIDKTPTAYLASDGAVYSIGEFITIGTPVSNKTFGYLQISDGFMYRREASITITGQKVEIKNILIRGSAKAGYYALIRCRGMINGVMDIGTFIEVQLENAIQNGEIKALGYTSDSALSELKKAKDKLELGLITKEEFEELKAKLAKYID